MIFRAKKQDFTKNNVLPKLNKRKNEKSTNVKGTFITSHGTVVKLNHILILGTE